ncbi:MAG: hypothetical protein AB7I33_08780 [Gemmatimonadales bacterium]
MMTSDAFDSAAYYTCDDDAENLCHETPEDAIWELLEDRGLSGPDDPDIRDVEVYAYARVMPAPREAETLAAFAMELIVERVEEEHGNPDGGRDVLDGADCEHIEAALAALLRDAFTRATPWACERVAQRTYTREQVVAIGREAFSDWAAKGADQ